VTTEQLEPVRARAERILGRSVVLADGRRQWRVPTSTVQAALVLRTDPFALDVRPEAFAGIVADVARQVDRPARDATLTIAGGKARVNPEQAGFRWGFAHSTEQGAPKVVPSVAGGVCQVSTTAFQPVFWAGYQIEERHWHMFAMKSSSRRPRRGSPRASSGTSSRPTVASERCAS